MGLAIPDGFVVLHEHSDHYSLQVTRPVPLAVLNGRLTKLLESLPQQTGEQYLAERASDDDQDM